MTVPYVSEPVPISKVQDHYLIHSADHAAFLRRAHNITGVLIGGLPQAPQQNVFLGLPLELMPEEARLLVEKGAAYIVDDTSAHKSAFLADGLGQEEKQRFKDLLEKQGLEAARTQTRRAEERKENALRKFAEQEGRQVGNGDMDNWNDMPDTMLAPRARPGPGGRTKSRRRGGERSASSSVGPGARDNGTGPPSAPTSGPPSGARTPVTEGPPPVGPPRSRSRDTQTNADDEDETLFGAPTAPPSKPPQRQASLTPATTLRPHAITPATSYPPLAPQPPPAGAESQVPATPESYAVYKHLHDKGYFLAPGLRFGCQYMAYPGDPLRYHSHFLVNGKGWDEEFDLMEVVGGGRLGTGVKKGFMLGGREDADGAKSRKDDVAEVVEGMVIGSDKAKDEKGDGVRTFVVEWAGM